MQRRIFSAGIAYSLGSVANSAALLLLIPVLVHLLSQAEYGIWAIYEIAILVLGMFAMLGMDVGLMREYWATDDEQERRRLAGTVVLSVALWSLVLVGLLAATATLVAPVVCGAELLCPLRTDWLIPALLIIPIETLFNLLLSILRIRERAASFAGLSFLRLCLFMAGASAGLLLGYGLAGALLGRLLGSALSLLAAMWTVRSYLYLRFEKQGLRRVVTYGLPILPAAAAAYVLLASDRYIMQGLISLEAVAIYTFAYKLATGLDVLVNRPFSLDWAPRRFAIGAGPEPGPKFAEALVIYLFLAGAVGLLIIAGAPFAFDLIAPP
ncbi:MAG: oligosaccharide flippase family protein, partial [Oscillochloris sp.]|nr:oligosaccharide flippase family protein [Oscillochloris sp.]